MLAARHIVSRGATSCVRAWVRAPRAATTSLLLTAPHVQRREVTTSERSGGKAAQGTVHYQAASVTVASTVPLTATAMMQVCWEGGGTDVYPYVWLRDNCQCSICFHPVSKMRKLLVEDLQLGVSPSDIQVVDSGRVIEVLWSDGHLATYPATWLHQRAFNTHKRDLRNNTVRSKPTLWGKELLENLPRASFPELLQDDSALLQFLQQLESHGLVVVSDTPTKLGQLHRLSDRVAYLSRSHYGETFIVESKNDPINLAYTAAKLEMHSDIPSRKYKPCIQMLHCIRQFHGEGGDNQLTDGFQVSHNFRTLHPDKFHILATTPVDFIDIGVEDGRDFFLVNHDPMIRLDINGQIQSVNFNQFSRDSYFRVPVEEVAGWYDAMKTFRDMVNDNQYCIEYKMKDGDILVFDNFRLLHGRKAYTIEGERVLEGGYWEWDDVLSRRRVLQAKLSNE